MSQQQAEFEEGFRDGPKDASYGGYAGTAGYNTYSTQAVGQRPLSQDMNHISRLPGPGQRLALAIVSLAVVLIALIVASIAAATLNPYYGGFFFPIIIAVFLFLVFSTVVVVINLLFNRTR